VAFSTKILIASRASAVCEDGDLCGYAIDRSATATIDERIGWPKPARRRSDRAGLFMCEFIRDSLLSLHRLFRCER
jgi:hypothetical protein